MWFRWATQFTCSSSVTSSNNINSFEESFTGYTINRIAGVVAGKVTNSLYYANSIATASSIFSVVVRKISSDGTQAWIERIGDTLNIESICVDTNELNFYFSIDLGYFVVVRLLTLTGALVNGKQFP